MPARNRTKRSAWGRPAACGAKGASRRGFLLAAIVGSLATLPGCGFELKRPPELRLKTLHLAGFAPMSPMAEELRRQLRASPQVQLVEAASQAEVVLHVLGDASEQIVAALSATGQVRELTLRSRLRFRASNAEGRELIPETELVLSRDMSYTETAAIAKEQEAGILFRSMQTDIATQVLRRLAALNGGNGARAPATGKEAPAAAAVPPPGAASAAGTSAVPPAAGAGPHATAR
jgi:LPS-assembly lipoprotein